MYQDASNLHPAIATHAIPFWAVVVFLFLLFPGLAILGHWLGLREYRRRAVRPSRGIPGEASLGALLALLGLLLGFTYSTVLQWREGRSAMVVEEAAAIGTAYLRADLLPLSAGRPLQEALLDYARTRIVPVGFRPSPAAAETFVARSLDAQAGLWPALMAATGPEVPAALQAHASAGVTEVLDASTRRIALASKTLPPLTMAFLVFVTGAGAFVIGNRSALQGRALSWRTFLFSLVLACVLVQIEDLDRSTDGFTTVPQDALRATVVEIEGLLGATTAPPMDGPRSDKNGANRSWRL